MASESVTAGASSQVIREARLALEPLLYRHETIKDDYEAQVAHLAERILAACKSDFEAALATIILDSAGARFAVNHSVNVALLIAALGLREQWSGEELQATLCAALTMNLSFAAQQDSMTGLASDLTLLQKSSIESHARLSHKLLSQKKIKNRDWLNAVMQHHERSDGTGFLGMRGDSISKFALSIGLADRYCMLVAREGSREPTLTERFVRQTVRHEVEESATRQALAERLGAYLPGTMVNLASGEVGIVWRYTDDKSRPLVSSLGLPGALSLDESTVRDTREKDYEIVDALELRPVFNRSKLLKLWGVDCSAAPGEPRTASAA